MRKSVVVLLTLGSVALASGARSDAPTTLSCEDARVQIRALMEKGDQAPNRDAAAAYYESAAMKSLELWRTRSEPNIRAGNPPECTSPEIDLETAERGFRAAHLPAKAIATGMMLENPVNHLSATEQGREAGYRLGATYEGLSIFDSAANWYEHYARQTPAPKYAAPSILRAIEIRVNTDDMRAAEADLTLLSRQLGNQMPAAVAEASVVVATYHAQAGAWEAARLILQQAMHVIDTAGAPDIQVRAHAIMARDLNVQKNPAADAEWSKVRALWSEAAPARVAEAEPNADRRQLRIALAVDAVGEALFLEAEVHRAAKVSPKGLPTFDGAPNKIAIANYMSRLGPAYREKQNALQASEGDYQRIVDLKPVPPSTWAVKAAARLGGLWANMADLPRKMPVPSDLARDPDSRAAYYDALDRLAEPVISRAKTVNMKCLEVSRAFAVFNEDSVSCETWLGRHFKAEFHPLEELRASPSLLRAPLAEPSRANSLLGAP